MQDEGYAWVIVKKHERTLNGFDDKVISLYSRGMSTRDIQAHLKEIYGVDVSSTFISTVTDSVLDEVKQWQQRPLEPIYPVVYLDGLVVKNREEGIAHNKCVYLALGINTEGRKELLGLWIAKNHSSIALALHSGEAMLRYFLVQGRNSGFQ